jgi:hypothetical protein
MDHYVAYHGVDLMGCEYPDVGNDFGHYSGKPESFLRKIIGNLVWVVVGKREGRQTRYRLAGVYSPDRLTHEEGNWLIQGRGVRAAADTDITDSPWFAELFREQNKFSFGMNRIRKPEVIEALAGLVPGYSGLAPGEDARAVRGESGRGGSSEPSFTYDEAFPLIARLIILAAKAEPGRFIPHDAIVDLILADGRGAEIVAHARSRSSWTDDRDVASNMVAWFSQQISVGRSEWLQFFERDRLEGAWAYRPTSTADIGPAPDIAVIEGEPRMLFHIRREREPRIAAAKRAAARNQGGELECEACGFVAQHAYSGFAGDVAEVHHRRALGDATGPVETKLDDLAVLCANCHRAIHQTRPLVSVEEFRERFLGARGNSDAV